VRTLLLIAVTLLAACSDDVSPTLAQASPAAPPPAPAATEKGDVAAAEVVEPADAGPDPCDLSGYDMSQMTVERHEELVKICQQSKP
jgi:hypothetical protein